MNINTTQLSDIARANRLGRKLELIIIIALTLSYITQGTKNSISIIGLVLILASLWIPVIISFFVYKANPESGAIKHVIGIGYGIFYLIVCLISAQRLVFAYAFPMLIVVTIFCDYAFSVLVSSCVIAIALVHAVIFTWQVGFTPENIAQMEIEIAATVLIGVYCIVGNKFVLDINQRHVKKARESEAQTENLLNSVMDVSNALAEEVNEVADKMNMLYVSSEETLEAMTEVQQGANDSAESVQTQLLKTEEIQDQISQVTTASENIEISVADSVSAIDDGQNNVTQLIKYAESSELAGNAAVTQLNSLKEYTSQMGSIVAMIQDVASQTNLLSLNASIEAARAGEAGRGFAVVASEISNLASQTQTATTNIHELIENVTAEVDTVTKAINELIESNRVQTESARDTADSFDKIAASTKNIHNNSESLASIVGMLEAANREIIDNIQTVSAITEEVSAHSTSTFEKTSETGSIVSDVQGIVALMTQNADRLKEL